MQPWNQATIAPIAGATPGFARFSNAALDHDVPGPGMSPIANWQLEPYLAMTGGGRLFDHNRSSDMANYAITAPDMAVWGAPATCGAPLTQQAQKLVFSADFTQHREGVLAAGGTVEIDYATTRLDGCHEVQGGHDLWALTAHLRFDPGEELPRCRGHRRAGGTPRGAGRRARRRRVWFEASDERERPSCQRDLELHGANYFFAAATPPNWLGLAENLLVRDAGDPCDGGSDAASGFSFDTWARQQAGIANLCFQVYSVGDHGYQGRRNSVAGARRERALAARQPDRVDRHARRLRSPRRQQRALQVVVARRRSVPRVPLPGGGRDAGR